MRVMAATTTGSGITLLVVVLGMVVAYFVIPFIVKALLGLLKKHWVITSLVVGSVLFILYAKYSALPPPP